MCLMLEPREFMKSNTFMRSSIHLLFFICYLDKNALGTDNWHRVLWLCLPPNFRILFVIVLKLKVNQIHFMRFISMAIPLSIMHSVWNLIAMLYVCFETFVDYNVSDRCIREFIEIIALCCRKKK